MASISAPSLTALRAFEAAARHLSFQAAATELAVTQSAISHQVADLERGLGVELNEAVALAHPYTGKQLHLEMADKPID